MEHENPKRFLLSTLEKHDLWVTSHNAKHVFIKMNYTIEIEGENLFKLSQDNQVIAPFADVEELCSFIKMDMELNEES